MSNKDPKSFTGGSSVDDAEVEKFAALARVWWDPEGEMKPLHRMNPARLRYLRDRLCRHFDCDSQAKAPLQGLRIVDIGCGGGLISEPLARLGAVVTAIDASDAAIAVATAHAQAQGLEISYRQAAAEDLAAEGLTFDAVVTLEVVEHVADLAAFLTAAAGLVRPGGALVLATLNRTAKAYFFAIVGAEQILRWLPKGTHEWDRFVRPSEAAELLGSAGITLKDLTGLTYNPLLDDWQPTKDLSVNYLAFGVKG